MKETKYIPGDLVMFKNPFEPSDTCVGIVKFLGNISDIILLCPYTNLNLEYFIKEENIQGIPITPEILEKNGWKRTQIFIDDDGLEFHTYIDDERSYNFYTTTYTPWSEAKELKENLRIKLKRVLLNV